MKSKKILVLIMSTVMLFSIFASCAKSPNSMSEQSQSVSLSTEEINAPDEDLYGEETGKNLSKELDLPDSASAGEAVKVSTKNRKIIYNANIYIETQKFDDSFNQLKQIIENKDAFIANSVLNSDGRYRTERGDYIAEKVYDVTIRVSSEQYASTVEEIKKIGAVIDLTEDSADKTSEYTDLDLRKKTLQVEADRLLDLLSKAFIIEDIIVLENRLTDVRYEMESMEQKIRSIDDNVSFSTITLLLVEVRDDIYIASVESTLGERIKQGLSKSLRSIKYSFENFLVYFITNIPYILILGVILLIAFFIFRKVYKKVNIKTESISKVIKSGPEKIDNSAEKTDDSAEKKLENKDNEDKKL